MSKDKGVKNQKKAPADKSVSKTKVSAYKSESKSGSSNPVESSASKADQKSDGSGKAAKK